MAETILSSFLIAIGALGATTNIFNYESTDAHYGPTKIFNDSQYVETPVNVWDARYNMVQDGNFPFSALRIPVDYMFQNRHSLYTGWGPLKVMQRTSFAKVPFILQSEYRTMDVSVKKNAKPISGWQALLEKSSDRNSTHYVHTRHCGSRFTLIVTFSTRIDGDIQIIRRILTDVLGTSGNIGADIFDLFKKAEKAVRESEDVRGEVRVHAAYAQASNTDLPLIFQDLEEMLKKTSEFPKHALPAKPGQWNPAVSATLKPLHDLDARYETTEKNTLVERYMAELLEKFSDAEFTDDLLQRFLMNHYFSYEDFKNYYYKVNPVKQALQKVFTRRASMYRDMDVEGFKSALEVYQNGLDNTTETYFADFLRWYEQRDIQCKDEFFKPTRGSLIVNNNEVIKKGKTNSVTECQDLCLEEKRCRAVEYDENTNECLVYNRSSRSARILFSQSSTNAKIYDRSCSQILQIM